ncbi:Glyoxylate reductase/hydroxypyruvate reductase, partial [Smittium mucronatum]
ARAADSLDRSSNAHLDAVFGHSDLDFHVSHVALNTLLAESDIVVITCSLSPETRYLINKDALAIMKSSALLINSARGPIVDNNDLADALENGKLFAAGLDVTDPEPIPPSHKLVSLPNCFILPHLGSATLETRNKMAAIALINGISGLLGLELLHSV